MSTQLIFDKLKNIRPAKMTKRDLSKVQLSRLEDIKSVYEAKIDTLFDIKRSIADTMGQLDGQLVYLEECEAELENLFDMILAYEDDIYELLGTDGPPELEAMRTEVQKTMEFDSLGIRNSADEILRIIS